MKVYGVIMAGGEGTRFWPLSRRKRPKQFLNLTGKELMINETIERLEGVVSKEDIFVVTNESQKELTLTATVSRILEDHILAEPAARNTAACIGYAAMEIVQKYGDGIMCILSSDHYIQNKERFLAILQRAVRVAGETDKLVTIGIEPTFPATGYGYIRYQKEQRSDYHEVEEFVEKPDMEAASAYLQEGNYLWNSGMFVWRASTILGKFKELLPDIHACLTEIGDAMGSSAEQETIARIYPAIPKISIDYGIMERVKDVAVIRGDFGWSDIGSWDALKNLYPMDGNGNINYGKQISIDTHNCISYTKDKLIATLGVEDLIIVEADDVVMVCHRERAQEVRRIVEALGKSGDMQYL